MRERGFLHADGYAGFNGLYEPDAPSGEARLVGVACSAHSRRKLFEVHAATGSVIGQEALMAALFKIEAVRQELSLPLARGPEGLPRRCPRQDQPQGSLAGAIRYSLLRLDGRQVLKEIRRSSQTVA